MGSLRVGHDWATSLSLFTFLHWRRKWQPTPVFLPGESQGRGSLVGCRLLRLRVGHDWSDAAAAAAAACKDSVLLHAKEIETDLRKDGVCDLTFLSQFFWRVIIFPRMGENSGTIYSWSVGLPLFLVEKMSHPYTSFRGWNSGTHSTRYSNGSKDFAVCTGSPHSSSFWASLTCVPLYENFGSQGKI